MNRDELITKLKEIFGNKKSKKKKEVVAGEILKKSFEIVIGNNSREVVGNETPKEPYQIGNRNNANEANVRRFSTDSVSCSLTSSICNSETNSNTSSRRSSVSNWSNNSSINIPRKNRSSSAVDGFKSPLITRISKSSVTSPTAERNIDKYKRNSQIETSNISNQINQAISKVEGLANRKKEEVTTINCRSKDLTIVR